MWENIFVCTSESECGVYEPFKCIYIVYIDYFVVCFHIELPLGFLFNFFFSFCISGWWWEIVNLKTVKENTKRTTEPSNHPTSKEIFTNAKPCNFRRKRIYINTLNCYYNYDCTYMYSFDSILTGSLLLFLWKLGSSNIAPTHLY